MSSMADDYFMFYLHEKRVNTFMTQDCENGFFDVTFDIDGKLLHAHKFVIATTSATFKHIFRNRSPFKSDPIIIDDFRFEDFHDFVLFAYTGQWKLMTDERILEMLRLSLAFQSLELLEKCDIYLSQIDFTVEKFYHFYDSLADCMCLLPLFKKSIRNAMKKLYPELLESERFVDASRETIKALVHCKRIYLMEEQLFKSLCKWVENQAFIHAVSDVKEYCIRQLSQIIPFVHFEAMSNEFLMDTVIRKGDLFGFATLSDVVRKRIRHDVEITDANEKKLCGTMFDRNNIIDEIEKVTSEAWYDEDGCHWEFEKPFFYERSKYSMKKGTGKYFLFIKAGKLVVSSVMKGNEYFLAELFVVDDGFVFEGCKISVF